MAEWRVLGHSFFGGGLASTAMRRLIPKLP